MTTATSLATTVLPAPDPTNEYLGLPPEEIAATIAHVEVSRKELYDIGQRATAALLATVPDDRPYWHAETQHGTVEVRREKPKPIYDVDVARLEAELLPLVPPDIAEKLIAYPTAEEVAEAVREAEKRASQPKANNAMLTNLAKGSKGDTVAAKVQDIRRNLNAGAPDIVKVNLIWRSIDPAAIEVDPETGEVIR